MGEPAYQLPEDDKPDIRPRLRTLEGGGETTAPARGHLSSVGGEEPSALGTSSGKLQPDSASYAATDSDSEDIGRFKRGLHKTKAALWGTKLRRKSTISGGIVGLLVGSLGIGSLWIAGPLEVIHIAQFLTKSHFQVQNDQGDERMGKLYRFVRSGGDAGETRLGWVGSHYKTTMISDMDKIGLKPVYGSTTIMQGFEVDTTNESSPYYNMNEDEIKARMQEKGFNTDGLTFKDGKAKVSANGFFGKDGGRAANRLLVKELGYKNIPGALRVRILNRYGMVTWHPLKKLDAKLNEKLADAYNSWKKDREERLRTGIGEASVQGTTTTEETDQNGHSTQSPTGDPSVADATVKDPSKSASVLKSISEHKGSSIAGGLAAVQGVVCGLRELGTGIDDVRYSQVVLPLMRMGWDAVTVGNQIMAGQDVDAQTVKFVSKSFTTTDPKTHQTSNWNQAASIQALEGNEGSGTPAPEAFKNIKGGIPSWLQWTQNSIVAGACSTGAQIAGGVVSVGLGLISGDIINQLGGLVVGMVAAPRIMAAATGFLAGQAVDVSAAGADYGSAIDYGSRLNANAAAMQFGGAPLSNSEVAQLDGERDTEDSKEFATKSFAYRLFNTQDNRTLASKLIDNSYAIQPKNVATTIASTFTSVGSFLNGPASLLTAKTHAATTYDYGFPQFGFSQADMDNSLVSDPYANADAVAKILDGPDGHPQTTDDDPSGYIGRADTCFGIQISYGENGWQAVTDTAAGGGQGINVYAKDYPTNCRDESNNQWLRVRFFIFDMGEMDGWACYQGDEVACQHDGVSDTPTQGAGSFVAASYNLLNADGHPDDSRAVGGCNTNPVADDPTCAKTRAARQADIISGKASNPQIDLIGTQETTPTQYRALMAGLPGYQGVPSNDADISKMTQQQDGALSIIWNAAKFTKFTEGKAPAISNVASSDRNRGGHITSPWVGLQTASGQHLYVMSIHYPNGNFVDPKLGDAGTMKEASNLTMDWVRSMKQSDPGATVMIMGDFNDELKQKLSYCIYTKNGLMQNTYDMAKGLTPDTPCPSDQNNGIDQVYVTPSVNMTASNWTHAPDTGIYHMASDHRPVYVSVSLDGAQIAAGGTGATIPGSSFVGSDGFVSGSCVEYVEYILNRHSSKYHGGALGNGKDVAASLGRIGYAVNNTPAVHATVSFPTTLADPTYGHVALVAAVNKDGSIVVEESNWANADHYGTHTVKASEVHQLTYAHTEVGWH